MVGAEWICTGSRSSPNLLALMTHVMDPTVKIWPGYGRDEEPVEKTILFDKETAHTPLPGAPTVDKRCSAVHRGVSHDGRFVEEVRVIKNKKTTKKQELDIFGPSTRHNTLLLWSVGLYW